MTARAAAFLIAAALGPAAAAQREAGDEPPRPNILFAIADDWSAGHASCLGAAWVSTPAFDRVAAEGMLFERAFASI